MSGTAFRARRSGRRRCPTPSRRSMSAPWASRRFRPRRCSPSSPDSRRSRRPRRSISARPTMFPPNSLPCWPVMRSLGGIRLFENTTSIADGAFKGCTALTRAVVPSGVAAVGPSTFEGCSALAEVTLPSSVASIADKAFSGCAALSEIALGNVKSIGDEGFRRRRIDRGVARRCDARCEGVPRLSGAGCGRTRFDRHRSRREPSRGARR